MADRIVHLELHGKDGKQLQEFYGKLFGWNVDANNPMNYGMVNHEESGVGAGITASDMAPATVAYVEVPDLGAALSKAKDLGATVVMEPMAVPGGPEIAQFRDPAGNIFGLTKAGSM